MDPVPLFDSHCHLQDQRIFDNIDSILLRAHDAGVETLLCCGSTEADWETVFQIYQNHKHMVIPAFGIHPWYVNLRSENWLVNLEAFLQNVPQAAVGEIGLDFSIDNYNKTDQRDVFVEQIRLARKYNRAASVHCRKAWGELVSIIRLEHGVQPGAVIHSYSGSVEMIEVLQNLGFSFSFSGSITNPANKRGIASVKKVPHNRLLIETDSPDIALFGWTGFNEPSNLAQIALQIAAIRGESLETIVKVTHENSTKLFKRCID